MEIKIFTLMVCFFIALSSWAQSTPTLIPGEMVIQFESEETFQKFLLEEQIDLHFEKRVSNQLDLHLFSYDPATVNIEQLSNQLNQNPLVRAAGQNFQLKKRATIPNDELFSDQNSFDLIEAPDAWDIVTAAPQEVVIAVVEGGDIFHEDLRDNIWTNPNETPNDGVDNDNNGFVDDFRGVNISTGTDIPIIDDHGTGVAGIIGARGDNGIGVAGMLWDVKMMIISSNLLFTEIIASYEYIFEMRKRYNETDGAEGAFIVVSNSSFGVNNAFPDEHQLYPAWCDAYDMMGSVGVLSAVATTNTETDIGQNGDMPGLCPSDYTIVVTDTNLSDELGGGYSPIHVDLSAPGRSVTTDLNDTYSTFTGTSAACPVVGGALGMMYSFPCEGLLEQSISNPGPLALQMKNLLLGSVDKIDSLEGKAVSEGRLNIFNALQATQSLVASPKGDLSFLNLYPNPANESIFVEYQTSETSAYDMKVYDAYGRLVYHYFVPEDCPPRIIEIPVLSMAPGMHFISIENINNIKSAKFWVY